ncbi:hypothetical protein ACFVOR_14570 [Streptomyces sp. NPDC057837]|uniref:phage tail protein n=1 Tax=Streptomyces sp. NPDC057837 TaxID=3346260 RepID=UPI0036BDF020
MALTVGELNAILSVDDRTVDPTLRRAENALRASGQRMGDDASASGQRIGDGIVRGLDGRLRDARGRFVAAGRSAGQAIGDGLDEGVADGAEEAESKVRSVGIAIGGLIAGLPAIAAVTTAGLGMVAAFASAQAAVKAFQLAAGPQLEAVQEAATAGEAAEKAHEVATLKKAQAQKLAAKGGDEYQKALQEATAASKAAKDADAAYQQQLDGLPPATREYAIALQGLKDDHDKWSESLSATTMPVFTRGIELARRLLPLLTPLVEAGATAFMNFFDEIEEGIEGGDLEGFINRLATSGARNLTSFLIALKNIAVGFAGVVAAFLPASDDMSGGLEETTARFAEWGQSLEGSEGFADFLELARQGATTLGTLATAAGTLLVAAGPLIGVTAQLALVLAQVINNTPTSVLTVLAGVLLGVKVGMLAYRAGATAVALGNRIMASSTYTAIAGWMRMMAVGTMAYAQIAAAATVSALRTAAVWAASAARMTATWLVSMLRVAAVTVAQFALMAGRAVIWAATMAAQWLIAMGPIGWVIAAVVGLVALVIANWDKVRKWTGQAWDAVWKKVKAAVTLVVAAARGLSKLPGVVLGYFTSMKNAATRKALELVSWMVGWPGRISRAVGSLNSLLLSKGRNVVQGLWSGIQSMGGWIKSKLLGWAKSVIPGPIAKALGIASPSKVTKAQGRWIARGLIDGLTGSSKQVKAASGKLADIIADSLRPGKKRSQALAKLGTGTKQLLALAKREEALAAKMKTSTKKLDDLRKAREKLAQDVAKGVLDSANITKQENDGWPVTAASILAGLQQDTAAAQQFAKNLATLRKKGVRSDLVAQIAQAGVEQGSAAAAALANADASQIKQINAQQKLLVGAANQAGSTAGNAMYSAGIAAGAGLVKGLQKQQRAIEKQMLRIAQGMSKSIRKALGIKSPSRVMALVGQYTATGLIRGVEGQRKAVNRSMASLVETPAPGSWDMASGRARAAAAGRAVLELRSSGRAEDDYLIERVRRGVRKKGGGDVDLVLAGRRSG